VAREGNYSFRRFAGGEKREKKKEKNGEGGKDKRCDWGHQSNLLKGKKGREGGGWKGKGGEMYWPLVVALFR